MWRAGTDHDKDIRLLGSFSSDGTSWSGTWQCTNPFCSGITGTWSGVRVRDSYEQTVGARGRHHHNGPWRHCRNPRWRTGCPETLTVQIKPVPFLPPSGLATIRRAYEFGPSGVLFALPVTVTFKYSDADIYSGVDPSDLEVYVLDSGTGFWMRVGGVVDTAAKTITFQTNHFSTYGAFAPLFDTDADDVADVYDNCPAVYNPGQQDADGDHAGDACDTCSTVYNPDQVTNDGQRRRNGSQIPGEWASNPVQDMPSLACTDPGTPMMTMTGCRTAARAKHRARTGWWGTVTATARWTVTRSLRARTHAAIPISRWPAVVL